MGRFCIGIDLGGTAVKYALVDEQSAPRADHQVATPAGDGADAVVEAMAAGAEQLLHNAGVDKADVAGVGIGSPGPLDIDAGIIIDTPNIDGFKDFPLRDRLADRLALPAVLENDANAAALGECLAGAARGARSLVLLTLGTGVGSGVIIDGRLVHGAHGMGGEIGHMIVDPGGRLCGCGQRGCVERYASATFLAQHARKLVEAGDRPSSLADVLAAKGDLDAKDVHQAALAGDAVAADVWDEALRMLAVACVNIARALDPELILFGGGMANAGAGLLEPLTEHYLALHWTLHDACTRLALAALGNDAGSIGAAGAAWEKFR